MKNQLSKHDFLKKETWVNLTQKTVITADITYENSIGDVHHGFNKKVLTAEQLGEAISSTTRDPGDYILEEFPAAGTSLSNSLAYLSIDDAYFWVKESLARGDRIMAWSYEDHNFGYQVSLHKWKSPEILAYETNSLHSALICASIADWTAKVVEADTPEAKGLDKSKNWVYLDRSKYGYSSVYLDVSDANAAKILHSSQKPVVSDSEK